MKEGVYCYKKVAHSKLHKKGKSEIILYHETPPLRSRFTYFMRRNGANSSMQLINMLQTTRKLEIIG